MAVKNVCAICGKTQSKGQLIDYGTILKSMGFTGNNEPCTMTHSLMCDCIVLENPYAHTKCVLKVQQQSLSMRKRLIKE